MGEVTGSLPGQREVISTGSDEATQYKYGVTNAAVQLLPANSTRRSAWLLNEGLTTLWIGLSSNVQAGASGINIGSLSSGSNTEFEHYRGPVWGRVGGASVAPLWVGAVDIG